MSSGYAKCFPDKIWLHIQVLYVGVWDTVCKSMYIEQNVDCLTDSPFCPISGAASCMHTEHSHLRIIGVFNISNWTKANEL